MPFSEADVPDQAGRVVVVTGANSGLGLENTRALASHAATVVMATRDPRRSDEAAARVRRAVPEARLEQVRLDLADLASVRTAADEIRARHPVVDVVICNAGLMATPERRTVDGFELQFGVNHLGHAALVAHLLPAVTAAPAGRVVVTSSEMHRMGRIDLDDLNWERTPYRRWPAYGRSKLANLLYVRELARRLEVASSSVVAAAAHPGYASTDLQTRGPALQGGVSGTVNRLAGALLNTVVAQSAAAGALPQLLAATAADVPNGSYWGPGRGMWGPPGPATPSAAARDDAMAHELWERTEHLTGASHDLPG